jgi:ATP-dependent DNA helicase RecG
MQTSLINLQKIFRLEANRGYDDEAIIGGLIKMVDFWAPEARNEKVPEDIIQDVLSCLKAYHDLEKQARSASLKELWGRIRPQLVPEPEIQEIAPETRAQPDPTPAHLPPPPIKSAPIRTSQPVAQKQTPRSSSQPGGITSKTPTALNASLTVLNGVGPRHAQTLAKLNLYTLGDMLYFFPRRYDDYSQLKPIHRLWYGDEVTVVGTVQSVINRKVRSGKMSVIEVIINDGTGALRLTWFNQPWLENRFWKSGTVPGQTRHE